MQEQISGLQVEQEHRDACVKVKCEPPHTIPAEARKENSDVFLVDVSHSLSFKLCIVGSGCCLPTVN